ncbi:nucleotidyltransferase domain-containing protein [Xenorhabdus sp. IM139775]|uniref:nucleotidyltransferase domain-containing protein n=1 Tax=Xenorhabdus sp. IM139775 TaxID=3025876 RepID=UPI002358E808|nr:nucleotidyltransferase [Xenorhabdus sp. IM139775]MDC9595178.1 nucleotidyltransferase [Xenorhabdus sp. IM139775]
MSLQNKFKNFHDVIKLGRKDQEYTTARLKDDSITSDIVERFKGDGYPVIEDFIQGSLATSTGIREKGEDFDIDRAIVIEAGLAPENPITPKLAVLEVLENRGFKNAKIKKPCVTADYKADDLHIDIPIYRKYDNGQYELAVGKRHSDEDNREWARAAPRELIDWVNEYDADEAHASKKHDQYRRIVRYLKRWRNFTFSEDVRRKIYSIGIAVMVKESFNSSINDEGFPDDLSALRSTINHILNYRSYFSMVDVDKYRVEATLPVSPSRDIFHNSSVATGTQFRNKMSALLKTLDKVADEEQESKQCELLRSVFGEDFPECAATSSASSAAVKTVFAFAGVVGTSQGA